MAKDVLGVKVFHLSEEHGILRLNKPSADLNVGDVIESVPAYAPTTVNLHDRFFIPRRDEIITTWDIVGRGRFD